MISADHLRYLTALTTRQLEAIALNSGYRGERYLSAQFLGLTNGGQFCYAITFADDGEVKSGKVFVTYDSAQDRATLDY